MKMPSVMPGSQRFARTPSTNIQRSQLDRSHGHKTTINAGYLYPIFWDEVLPGDTLNLKMSAFARLTTLVKPILDNLWMDSHFFFIPNRLIWENWAKFCGEQEDPGDSISYTVPHVAVGAAGITADTVDDYLGVPVGVTASGTSWTYNALPRRAYYCIWNNWFRDQNLQDTVSRTGVSGTSWDISDGPDGQGGGGALMRRGKRHDYFTSCLPWAQKETAVTVTLGTIAVDPDSTNIPAYEGSSSATAGPMRAKATANPSDVEVFGGTNWSAGETLKWSDPSLEVDLDDVMNVSSLREAFQIQKMLEKDARGGTRYPEILMSHFKIRDPQFDVLQRPEYLGGGTAPVTVNPVTQTSRSESGGGETEQGNLTGIGTFFANNHGFTKSFTEHGIVMGLISIRADLNYQEGLERSLSRETRYDYYWPSLANLGEQAVLNKELVLEDASSDDDAFGYQERWAEYRYKPSKVTSEMRSNHAQTLEVWHLAQDFAGSCPNLDSTFIVENPDMARIVASTTNNQFYVDAYFRYICARPMPLFSVPGLIDHF